MSWLRRYPRLEASKDLRKILLTITNIKDVRGKEVFIKEFNNWEKRYGQSVLALPSRDKVYGDLQRTRSLILHALHQQQISWKVISPDLKKFIESIGGYRKSIGIIILPGTLT